MLKLAFAAWAAFFLLSGCAKQQPEAPVPLNSNTGLLEIKFLGYADRALFAPGSPLQLPDGRPWQLDLFRFYVTDIELLHADGRIDTLSRVELIDLDPGPAGKVAHGPGAILEYRVPVGEYRGLRLRLGLDSLQNASDPSRFGPEHPLSALRGMFWTWKTGYRFAMCEGLIDVSPAGDGSQRESFAYHPGANDLGRQLSFSAPEHRLLVAPTGIHHYNVELELDSLFVGAGAVPFKQERQVHGDAGTLPVARAFMDRLAAGASLVVE